MAEWTGDIRVGQNQIIKDITLVSTSASAIASKIASRSLGFLAVVDTARIPLYLAAGPSLDVWTTCEATEEWFATLLASKPPTGGDTSVGWWEYTRAQSPVGILVRVDGQHGEKPNAPRITEILFYATVATPTQVALPTPPSSSPDLPGALPEQLPELKVHALPLSSDRLYQQDAPVGAPLLPLASEPSELDAHFLAPQQLRQATPTSPKRKCDIFDDAALARKKARAKGGAGVSAAAAKVHNSQNGHYRSLSIDTKIQAVPDSRPTSAHGVSSRPPSRALSRSPSLTSDTRPLSRKGLAEGQSKKSTLSQVATIPLQPEEPTTETRNREALSRVVMTAMRMHGLQQRKKSRSRRNSVAPSLEGESMNEEAAAYEAAKDEEYRLIYHQTYKGAALALRKHIVDKPLHSQPDRLRDVVEKLLTVFCTDPLTQPFPTNEPPDPLATPGTKSKLIAGSPHSHASPFDLPSGARTNAVKLSEGHMHTGSPISRKPKERPQGTYD